MTNKKPKIWEKSLFNFDYMMATWFWTGLFPKAPGTAGSIAALPFSFIIFEYSDFFGFNGTIMLGIAVVIITLVGLRSSRIYMERTGQSDPGPIVIDEVAGQWLTCMVITDHHEIGQFLLALLAFRLFDIMKPWPISIFDKRHDAFGVMFDDIAAGLMAAAVLIGVNYYIIP